MRVTADVGSQIFRGQASAKPLSLVVSQPILAGHIFRSMRTLALNTPRPLATDRDPHNID